MAGKRGNGEGSIYQRGDGKWCASVTLEGGRRKVLYGKTRAEVAGKLTAALRDVQQGLPVATERLSVGQYLARWLDDAIRPKVRPSTYQSYERLIRLYIVPELGKQPLAKLSPQQVQALLNKRAASGLAPRTVQYAHAVLRHALNRAVKWGLVARNVATLVDPPRGQRPKVAPLTAEQARALLAAAAGHRLGHLVTVVLATGLRMGEALALRWDDLDLDAGTLTVRHTLERIPRRDRPDGHDGEVGWRLSEPKSERGHRTLPLIPAARSALR
ncbi:MAG: tyrosine-type recombinase/integrase, partial [Chloroflexota bacterium]